MKFVRWAPRLASLRRPLCGSSVACTTAACTAAVARVVLPWGRGACRARRPLYRALFRSRAGKQRAVDTFLKHRVREEGRASPVGSCTGARPTRALPLPGSSARAAGGLPPHRAEDAQRRPGRRRRRDLTFALAFTVPLSAAVCLLCFCCVLLLQVPAGRAALHQQKSFRAWWCCIWTGRSPDPVSPRGRGRTHTRHTDTKSSNASRRASIDLISSARSLRWPVHGQPKLWCQRRGAFAGPARMPQQQHVVFSPTPGGENARTSTEMPSTPSCLLHHRADRERSLRGL